MNTQITHEELNILNGCLSYINPHEKHFSIEAIHAEKILKPLYPNEGGGIDLTKYNAARKKFNDKKTYEHITNWLIQYDMAEKVEQPSSSFIYLKLTRKGEVLWAYGDCLLYTHATKTVDKEKVNDRIAYVIENAPPYGEFTIIQKEPQVQFINIDPWGPEDHEKKKIEEIISGKTGLIQSFEQSLIDESALQLLVNEGFAVNRHDIQVQDKIYRQLTEKGRKLKELGSIPLYHKYESEQEGNKDRQKQRDMYLFWIVLLGALGTGISALFDGAQLLDFYNSHHADNVRILDFCFGFAVAILLWSLSWLFRKTLERKSKSK